MNRKKIVLVVLVLLAGLAIFITLHGKPTVLPSQELSLHKLPASPDISTVAYDNKNDSLIFSNGRYIVSLDSKSQVTRQLTATTSLPLVSDIKLSPDGQYLAFQTADQTDNKTLQQLLGPEGLVDAPTWWLVNLTTQTLTLVGQEVVSVEWSEDRLLFIFDQTIVSLDPGTSERRVIYGDDQLADFRKLGDALLLAMTDGKIKIYIISSGDEKVIGTETSFAVFNDTNMCYLSTVRDEKKDESDIFLHNCGSSDESKIATTKEGFFDFTESGGEIVYEENGEIIVLSNDRKTQSKITLRNLVEGLPLQKAFTKNILLFSSDTAYYIATSKEFSVKVIDENQKFSENGITFELSAADQLITISKAGSFSGTDKAQSQTILQSHGYDSNLYRLFYYTY